MTTPYRILDRKRRGETLSRDEIESVVAGATDGGWSDAQLAAFLMAAAIHGLGDSETRALTSMMLESGEKWKLGEMFSTLTDKHSTGGVGDKVSLVLSPVLAACGVPVAMLTGRGLGHTGGTADKLEGVPGLRLDLTRTEIAGLLETQGMAIGMATDSIAPADRKLYSLRDVTGTVVSIPLIVASILSKKLALGARGVVYDVKTGSGAFLEDREQAMALADLLVSTSESLGTAASALVTDMSQPLGHWVGHDAELLEAIECLEGDGPPDVMQLILQLALEMAALVGVALDHACVEASIGSGRAREVFFEWAAAQGGEASWLARPTFDLATEVSPVLARSSGYLSAVDTRGVGLMVSQVGGGRRHPGDTIDHGVAFHCSCRIGDRIESGQELGRFHLRRPDAGTVGKLADCFTIDGEAVPPPLVWQRVGSRVPDRRRER